MREVNSVYLNRLQQQAGTQETGEAGDEPHHGDALAEPVTGPDGHAVCHGDPRPAAPQGGAPAPGRKPPGTTHVRHNWRERGRERERKRERTL